MKLLLLTSLLLASCGSRSTVAAEPLHESGSRGYADLHIVQGIHSNDLYAISIGHVDHHGLAQGATDGDMPFTVWSDFKAIHGVVTYTGRGSFITLDGGTWQTEIYDGYVLLWTSDFGTFEVALDRGSNGICIHSEAPVTEPMGGN